MRVVNASLGGPGLEPVAAGGDPGAPEHAVRDRRGQRQRQRRLHALRPVRTPGGQRPVRRRLGLQRHEGVVLQLRRAGRRRLRAGHADPLDLHLVGVRTTCRAPRWPARTRPASRRWCSRRARASSALDIKSAIMASTDAKPDLMGKAVTGGRVNADRAVTGALGGAPVNVTPPAISGTPRAGRPAGRVARAPGTRPGPPTPTPGSAPSTTARRGRRSSARPPTIYTPGASDIGAPRARHRHRHQPVRRRELDLGGGRPGRSRAPRSTPCRRSSAARRAAARRSPSPRSGARPGRPTRSSGSARPTASPGRTIGTSAASYTLTTADAGRPHPRDGHRDQRLRAGVGDQRSGRARSSGIRPPTRRRRRSPAPRSAPSR